MNWSMKHISVWFLLPILGMFQANTLLARDDDVIKREIEAKIGDSERLRDTRIEVQVQERLVVLTGQVRLYEQKLISDRLAWTTPGVFEVDNEIRVVPNLPLSDIAIEGKLERC